VCDVEKSLKYLRAKDVYGSVIQHADYTRMIVTELLSLGPDGFVELVNKAREKKALSRRQEQLLLMAKIPMAVGLLNNVLGYPPDIRHIAEALDEPYKRIWRVIRKTFPALSLVETSARKEGLRRIKSRSSTRFEHRQVGRKYNGEIVGGPSRLYVYDSEFRYLRMRDFERKKLIKYMSESYFRDALNNTIRDLMRLTKTLMSWCERADFLKALHSFFSLIGMKIVQIAESEGKEVSHNQREHLSFNWLCDDALREKVLQSMKEAHAIKIPEDKWKREISSWILGDMTYPVEDKGKLFLPCIVCGHKIQYSGHPSVLRCKKCGSQYELEKRARRL